MELIKNTLVTVFLVSSFLAFNINAQQATFDITNYGARPGQDISEPLSIAWREAIASIPPSKVIIPPGTWPLSQVRLIGPAKAPIELEIKGTLEANPDNSKLPNKQGEWVTINYVNGLTISGGGVLDGKGELAWKKNDCAKNSNCAKNPINLSLNFINNSIIHDVTTKDSKNFHVNCISSNNVTFRNFHVSAPGDSANTDGLHLARSSKVTVIDTIIETGDDCISIGDDSSDLLIQNVKCGPGHGISIGSLGKYASEKDVRGVYVRNCTFKGTSNGIRIKTWPSAPATLKISDLRFEDLIMDNVSNPIIIDQEYCPWNQCNKAKPSLIRISNVSIKNIKGTSYTAEVVTLACSSGVPCQNVEIGNIDLAFVGTLGNVTTICDNVKPSLFGTQNPPMCAGPPKVASA